MIEIFDLRFLIWGRRRSALCLKSLRDLRAISSAFAVK
jgi:hypothetical protein